MRTDLVEDRSTRAESPAIESQGTEAADGHAGGQLSWLQRTLRRRHYWINWRSQFPPTALAVLATVFFVVMFNWAMLQRTTVRRQIITEIRPFVEDRLREQDQAFHGFLLAMSAGFIVCLTLGMVIFTHRTAGPVHRVRLHMKRVVDGDLDHKVTLRNRDNFKDLAADFNTMVEALRERREGDAEALEGLALRLQQQSSAETRDVANALMRMAREKAAPGPG
jgi:methyl-accepting chemotaxis protein